MIRTVILAGLALVAAPALAQDPPLIGRDAAAALAGELSGAAAKRTVQALSLHHRMRGSQALCRRRRDHREGIRPPMASPTSR